MDRLVLQVGDRSPRVAEVRATLARLGLLDGFSGEVSGSNQRWSPEDEFFDDALAHALRAFQQQRGIIADGMITNGTLRALREASYTLGARVLSLNTNQLVGDDVTQLQTQLHDLGFYTSRVDGHFGTSTHNAVVAYQTDYALKADGVVGPDTLRALSYLGRRITGGSPQSIREKEQIRSSGPQLSGKRVVIDPALGGANTGYTAQGPFGQVTEEEILWDLAGRIEGRMIAAGMETIISRPRSADPSSQDRANIANAFGADLLISLKADIYPNEKAHGVASFYFGSLNGYSSLVGERLSGFIQREICARTPLQNCFNHGRTWDILRLTGMPAVQVVPGYMTNPGDLSVLTDPAMRDKIAEAIVVSVKRLYLMDKDVHATGTFNFADILKAEGTHK
ncbi:N-acetylmuramoyl-L-alanine amidase [Corynebacterium sp. 319]|uniref:N-acetylmuramoyl-L-alanine amidase n=1 Tax=unclassified Corynebacterium TaxID=2624378 RepID=UPI00125CBC9D|nr:MULTISPECIES: N-acetylmuramoyl-L-alanine amidase [unclassified Corynebacterium]KAB1550445.1 N-acetylmuramoyl-L-alanine amidase [Corynebacterium sp. 319]KAB1554824.1 N-acetylmuramoyl-L-alanine amidase [Corynebacterium sp. 321]KAB3539796.1 N-acetylmuramoyl-L-alanine amidase [Corynebacterium sp. 366]